MSASSGTARASAALPSSRSSANTTIPAAGYSARADVLPLRRLVHRHHDGDQPLRAAPPRGARSPRRQPVHLDGRARPGSRTSCCRPAPTSSAGTSATGLTASGYGMHKSSQVNHRLIVLEDSSASSRSARGKSDYETRAARRASSGSGRHLHRGRPERARLGQADLCPPATCPSGISWEEFADKGYYLVPGHGETMRPRRRCAGSPRACKRDTPGLGPAAVGTRTAAKGCRRSRARSSSSASSLKRFYAVWGRRRSRSAPSWAPSTSKSWEGHHTEELTGPLPAAAHLPAPALQLPHDGRRQGRLGRGHRGSPRG